MTTRLPTDPAPFLVGMPWPKGTPISQEFGAMDSGYAHRGRDAACPVGTPIVSPAPGVVVSFVNSFVVWNGAQVRSFGIGACIDYENGLYGLVAHLSRLDVNVGDRVARGQQLGLSGNTGVSTGPHCHYQICTSTSFPVDIAYSRDPRDFETSEEDLPMTPAERAEFDDLKKRNARLERIFAGWGFHDDEGPNGGNYLKDDAALAYIDEHQRSAYEGIRLLQIDVANHKADQGAHR